MDLADYLATERGRGVRLAGRLGTSAAFVSQLGKGDRPVPPEHCVAIEVATEHAVRRWDLRPTDWHRIWPELIGADGAPAVPTNPIKETVDAKS